MTVFDIEEKPTESGSFDLKGGGKIHLRLLSGKDIKEISKASMTVEPEYALLKDPVDGKEKYQRFEARKFDNDLFDEMLWDRNITGWENLFDKNKKEIPVTKENKVLLMTIVPEFKTAYEDGLTALKKADADKEVEEGKNVLPS